MHARKMRNRPKIVNASVQNYCWDSFPQSALCSPFIFSKTKLNDTGVSHNFALTIIHVMNVLKGQITCSVTC